MSLLHPPPGFPPHLAVIWPLIWVQVLVLRAAVRAAYGWGVKRNIPLCSSQQRRHRGKLEQVERSMRIGFSMFLQGLRLGTR